MKRGGRRPKVAPPAIETEDRTRDLPIVRLGRAMERLQLADRDRYMRIVELAETYAAIYDRPDETRAEFEARLARVRVNRPALN